MLKKTPRLLAAFAAALSLAVPAAPDAFAQTTRLHHAAREGMEAVREKLPGRQVNAQTPEGETALHWALKVGDLNTPEDTKNRNGAVYLLLEAGADPFIRDNQGVSPTHQAVRIENVHLHAPRAPRGSLGFRKNTFAYGAALAVLQSGIEKYRAGQGDINVRDSNGNTPLHLILSPDNPYPDGDERVLRDLMIRRILLAGGDPAVLNDQWFTPLHLAALQGVPEVRTLLDNAFNSPDINVRDGTGMTPLHWALGQDADPKRSSVKDVVQLLLVRGADPTALDRDGESPLERARRRGLSEEIIALLREQEEIDGGGDPRLIREIKKLGGFEAGLATPGQAVDQYEVLRLIEAGVDVNVVTADSHRHSPLHLAATYGYLQVVLRLLQAGVDVNILNASNETAAHTAALLRNAEILAALIARGADLTLRDSEGHRPFCQPSVGIDERIDLALEVIDRAEHRANMTRRMLRALSGCDA